MTNKRENNKIESTRPPSNKTIKRDHQENRQEPKRFNDAGGVSGVHVVGHATMHVHNEGGPMRTDTNPENGRERLKRHRVEVAGHVWIPEIWGQEELLKDWIDCNAFDSTLMNNNKIMSAKSALVEERGRLRIANSY